MADPAGNMPGTMTAHAAALALDPGSTAALVVRGVLELEAGRPEDALVSFDRALAVTAAVPDVLNNRALALLDLGRAEEALASLDATLRVAPRHPGALLNRAGVLTALGRHEAARLALAVASAVFPDHPGIHEDLGLLHRGAAEAAGALRHLRRSVALSPVHARARAELGNTLRIVGEIDPALRVYRQALAIDPAAAESHGNLGYGLLARADPARVLVAARRAFALRPAREIAALVVKCLEAGVAVSEGLWPLAERILSERWVRPGPLIALAWHLQRSGRAFRTVAASGSPAAISEFLSGNPTVRDLLPRVPVQDGDVEAALTSARAHLLGAALDFGASTTSAGLSFFCALARQCFLNEYVFAVTDDESAKAEELGRRLGRAIANGDDISPWLLVAVAAYGPLGAIPGVEALLDRRWPEAVDQVLTQQVREPIAERAEVPAIRRLTPVAGEVSRAVRRQYEENPYPRWIDTVVPGAAVPVDAYLRNVFPQVPLRAIPGADRADILVAGCGTGQQSIETAATFASRSVLAVDLSLASLAYAIRKSREHGVMAIEYAQADIMELTGPGCSFDLIEASGVLHHLADPFGGWQHLASLLRPGGVMRIGLYSARARRHVAVARRFAAERGYRADAGGIRTLRRDLRARSDESWAATVVASADFATVSGCRDLLMHVQEHSLDLPRIAEFIEGERLRFLGFEVSEPIKTAYRRRHPGDLSLTDLRMWHLFEGENPDTFRGMYQFWVQKVV